MMDIKRKIAELYKTTPDYVTVVSYGFKIKNMSRLYSTDILKYPIEYFCILIEK